MDKISNRILFLIHERKDLTQKKLAEYIGVSSSTLNNWLKLGRDIPADKIIPISEFFNISCYYLLTGIKDEPNQNYVDQEFLSLFHRLPPDTQAEIRGEIKGYLKRMSEEAVAAASDDYLEATGTK